jgi:hypothetical protein
MRLSAATRPVARAGNPRARRPTSAGAMSSLPGTRSSAADGIGRTRWTAGRHDLPPQA